MSGHVRKRPEQKHAPWQVAYYVDGRRRYRSYARKVDAERFLATVTVDTLKGEYVDPRAGRETFGAYAARWVDERPIRESTRTLYRAYLAHCGEISAVRLGELRPSAMRTWQAAVGRRLAKSTARTIRDVVATILADAVTDRLIARSPLDGVEPPPKPDRQLVWPLSVAHVLGIRDAITPRYSAAITLGAGTGVRRGEAFGLTVDRVDWLRRTVTIDRQLIGVTGDSRPIFGPPKTAASVRVIPVSTSVLDALAAHLTQYGEGAERLIFTAPRGGPVTRGKVGEAWRDAEVRVWADVAGMKLSSGWRIPATVSSAWTADHPAGHGHRFHELRHFYASTLIKGGESVKVIQARLGHASSGETLDTYGHMFPDDDERTRTIIDALFNAAADASDTGATRPPATGV